MKITAKGQVTIPKAIRDRYGLRPGSQVRFVEEARRVVLRKAGMKEGEDVWEKCGNIQPKRPFGKRENYGKVALEAEHAIQPPPGGF